MKAQWEGLEVCQKSNLTRCAKTKIDRVQVRFFETLEGDGYYILEGGARGSDMWVPLEIATHCASDAWREKLAMDDKITRARSAFYEQEERKRWIREA